jgi:RNA polymerase sigma-70 factor (ECF subfamily)
VEPAARQELTRAMVRLADGDRTAFDAVYAYTRPLVAALCARMLDDPGAAEDATQQALLAVFARASEFDPGRDALPWVLGIAAWECRTARRRTTRRREDALPDAIPVDPPDDDLVRAVRAVVGELAPADAATLRAVLDDDRPDVPPATFRKRVQRALARFGDAWRTRHGQ